MKPGVLLVRDTAQADELAGQVRASAAKLQTFFVSPMFPSTAGQLERGSVQVWPIDV